MTLSWNSLSLLSDQWKTSSINIEECDQLYSHQKIFTLPIKRKAMVIIFSKQL